MVKNLTKGNPLKLLFFFAFPMVLGNLLQQLYNMVDSMVVGKFVGEDALAAVGSSFPIVFLAVAIATGLSMGCTVVISQLFGAQKIVEMKTTIYTALISLGILGFAIMAAGQIIASPMLHLLGTDPDIMADSLLYLRIYFGGAIFLFLYNTLNGIYNALGDSKTPLKFLASAAFINIGLDLLFVIRFHMGVAGVAWATLIAQGLCAVISFVILMHRVHEIENEAGKKDVKPELFKGSAVKKIAKIGIPSMIQQSAVSVSMMCMQGLVNSYGKVFVAGYTAATKIDSIAMLPDINFGNAMSSYTAQNIGAGKDERVQEGFRASLFMATAFSAFVTGCIFMFGPNLLGLFLETGAQGTAMGYGMDYLKIVSVFYVLLGFMFVGNGLLRGAGDMGTFMASSITNLAVRVVIAYSLSYFIGSDAIWWSVPIGWGVGSVICYVRIRSGKWKHRNVLSTGKK